MTPELTPPVVGPPLPPLAVPASDLPPPEESMLEFCCGSGMDIGEAHLQFCGVVLGATALAFFVFAVEQFISGRSRRRWRRSRLGPLELDAIPHEPTFPTRADLASNDACAPD